MAIPDTVDCSDLIADGQCSSKCLRAQTSDCRGCPCQGRHHGLLAHRGDHRVRGHPLFGENLHIATDGRRRCKLCTRYNGRRTMQAVRDRRKAAAR